MDLRGKVAIVTGGAQGIGKAICSYFIQAGAKVVLCDIDDIQGELFIEELTEDLKQSVKYEKCDVSSFEEFKAAFETAKSSFGRIDIVVNNAGTINETQWRKMVDVNFSGVVHGIQLGFSYMGKDNGGSGGHIINVSSNGGLAAYECVPVYCGTKHAVIGLTRSYGHQYHYDKTGVMVTAICPGCIDTRMYYAFPSLTICDEDYVNKYMATQVPVSTDVVVKAVQELLHDGRNGAIIRANKNGTRYVEWQTVKTAPIVNGSTISN